MIECETIFRSSIYLKLANWKFTKASNWRKQSFRSRSRYSTKVLLELHKIYKKKVCRNFFYNRKPGDLQLSQVPTEIFSYEFREIFYNNLFEEHVKATAQNCANVLSIWKVLYFVIASNSRFYTVELNRRAK